MVIRMVASQCGTDFDEYVACTLGSWEPSSRPAMRTLTNLWQGRRCKVCLPGQGWHQGKVGSWTQSLDRLDTYSNWSLVLEISQDAAEPDLKRRKVVNSAGEVGSVGSTGTTSEEEKTEAVMTFLVNRMNIEGGGTLKPVSSALSYRCPYCRAIEPVVAAHEDPSQEKNAECPVCLEMCACRVLQCGHSICHSCWDRCRRVATVSSVEVDEVDVEQIEKDRAERQVVGFTEALRERLSAFTKIAHEASSGREGLTRFYRELMVEHPTIWMHPILYPLYEEMSMKVLKIVLHVLEDRKVEFCSGIGLMCEHMFHGMNAVTAIWIAESYTGAGLRLSIPWLHLASYHMAKRGCASDEVKPHCTTLGLLHLKYGQLTQSLHSFDECLDLDADEEEAREGRERVLLEMIEWTGASGKLTPKC